MPIRRGSDGRWRYREMVQRPDGTRDRISGCAPKHVNTKVPRMTAHAMRGLLATLTAKRGLAGHLIAEMLGHADECITMKAYAAPGAAATGVNRRGLEVLNGGRSNTR